LYLRALRKRITVKLLHSILNFFKENLKKMNYTKHQLQKIEELLVEVGYQVRYEKGSFQSGYCLVEDRKIAVVNKFFETEGRINTLLDIVDKIEIPSESVSEKSQKVLKEISKGKKE
jgi:hypothetical protein